MRARAYAVRVQVPCEPATSRLPEIDAEAIAIQAPGLVQDIGNAKRLGDGNYPKLNIWDVADSNKFHLMVGQGLVRVPSAFQTLGYAPLGGTDHRSPRAITCRHSVAPEYVARKGTETFWAIHQSFRQHTDKCIVVFRRMKNGAACISTVERMIGNTGFIRSQLPRHGLPLVNMVRQKQSITRETTRPTPVSFFFPKTYLH